MKPSSLTLHRWKAKQKDFKATEVPPESNCIYRAIE